MIRSFLAWGPAAVWAAVLFYFSSRSWPGGAPLGIGDKTAHLLVYGVLGAVLAWGRERWGRSPSHWIVLGAGMAYALTDEYHQSLVPGRVPSAADLLADAAGLCAGYGGFLALTRRGSRGR